MHYGRRERSLIFFLIFLCQNTFSYYVNFKTSLLSIQSAHIFLHVPYQLLTHFPVFLNSKALEKMKMLLQNLAACLLLLLLKKTHYLIMPCEGIQPMKGSSAGKEYRFVQKNLSLLSCTLSRVIFAHFVRSFEKRIADSYIFPTKAALS